MKEDSSPYSKEKDPLYDPTAPDWEQFDRSYDDEDNSDNDDTTDDNTPDLKKSVEEGFMTGIALGL